MHAADLEADTVPAVFALPPVARRRWRRPSLWLAGAAVAAAIATGYSVPGAPIALAAIVAVFAVARWLDSPTDVAAYLALLSVQLPVEAIAFRLALSDFFMLPVIIRSAWALRGRPLVTTTLHGPFLAVVGALALGTAVAFLRTGHVGLFVLLNKDAGIVYLVLCTYALMWHMRATSDVGHAIDLFVIGVSVANVLALVATILAVTGFPNPIYLDTSGRLYGWLMNPSSQGLLLVMAAMLELPRLGFKGSHHPRILTLRWLNYLLLIVGVELTLSRSAWVALTIGSAVILFLWAISRRRMQPIPLRQLAAAVLTMMAPGMLLGWIAVVQWGNIRAVGRDAPAVATMEQQALVGQCLDPSRRNAELCDTIPQDLIEAERARLAVVASAPPGSVPAAPAPARIPPATKPAINPDGAFMNARGIEGRATIFSIAGTAYTSTLATELFGVGVGSFMDISARRLGVPVIVHNTVVWFLVEMGPLGLAAILWLLGRTAVNLWRTRLLPEWQGDISRGVTAAFLAWFAFSMFNEALYVRQLWLLFACADQLYVLTRERYDRATT